VKRDPLSNSQTTYSGLQKLFAQSISEYDGVLGSINPNLSQFRDQGGKMITWHGLADNLIVPGGTLNYCEPVDSLLGGTAAVDNSIAYLLPQV
jgi:hypothetical protein